MATLALKPIFPMRTGSSGSKRSHRKQRARDDLHAKPWRTMAITVGAVALTFFSVLAPIVDDPAGRLLALEQTPTLSTEEAIGRDPWSLQAFELTPTMLGPAITDDALILAEEDAWVVTMPELEVRAMPPIDDGEPAPPG